MLVKHQNPCNMSIRTVTRTIDDAVTQTDLTFNNIDPDWAVTHPNDGISGATIALKGTRRLFEAYTPNSTPDHTVFKDFQHYKAESTYAHGVHPHQGGCLFTADLGKGVNLLSTCVTKDDRLFNQWCPYGPPGQFNTGLTAWYVPQADGGFIPVPSDLEQMKLRGLKAMMPKVKADLGLLVSLYEIKDILSIKGSIKRLGKMAKQVASRIGGSSTRPIGKALARGASDAYLQGMFNVKPLISDIGGIYRAVATYERRINDLINRSGKTQLAHFKCNLKELLVPTWEAVETTYPVGGHPLNKLLSGSSFRDIWSRVAYGRETVTDSAVFRCCMQYNYTFTAFQREHAKLLGLADALGINFNPRYIWEVIPWSFVIDWVVDVGQWLDQFEVKNLEPKVNILQYCWSIKKTRRVAVHAYIDAYSSLLTYSKYPLQYIRLPDIHETSYRRGTDLPSSGSFTTSGLSSTELSLGAALITTRNRRKARKWNESSFSGLAKLSQLGVS